MERDARPAAGREDGREAAVGRVPVDSSGYRYGDLVLSAMEAGLWVDYLSASNPVKDGLEEELKHTWVVRCDDVIIGSGWYE